MTSITPFLWFNNNVPEAYETNNLARFTGGAFIVTEPTSGKKRGGTGSVVFW